MSLSRLLQIEPLAVRVCLPTDRAAVLPRCASESQITAGGCARGRVSLGFYPWRGFELLPTQGQRQLPNLSSGIFPLYFPL